MKILQISAVLEPGKYMEDKDEAYVYGLGDDQNVYYWGKEEQQWKLYSAKN